MKCSRFTLSILLAAMFGATVVFAPASGRGGMAVADFGPTERTTADQSEPTEDCSYGYRYEYAYPDDSYQDTDEAQSEAYDYEAYPADAMAEEAVAHDAVVEKEAADAAAAAEETTGGYDYGYPYADEYYYQYEYGYHPTETAGAEAMPEESQVEMVEEESIDGAAADDSTYEYAYPEEFYGSYAGETSADATVAAETAPEPYVFRSSDTLLDEDYYINHYEDEPTPVQETVSQTPEYGYEYGYGYEYDYPNEYGFESQPSEMNTSDEAESTDAEPAAPALEDQSECGYQYEYCYPEEKYGWTETIESQPVFDTPMEGEPGEPARVEEPETDEASAPTEPTDGDGAYEYGYDRYQYYTSMTEDPENAEASEPSQADAAAPAPSNDDWMQWEDNTGATQDSADTQEPYGCTYEYSYPSEAYGYEYVEGYGYDAYSYEATFSKPSEDWDMSEYATQGSTDDAYYDYWLDEPAATDVAETSAVESGLELFHWLPAELLILPDQDLLRTLERMSEECSSVRRAALSDYIQSLGHEAIDFAGRFEDETGIEVLSLADDITGAAALLACFRLYEQGELGTAEAIDVLRRSLRNPTSEWYGGVREITADAYEGVDEEMTGHADDTMVSPQCDNTTVLNAIFAATADSIDTFSTAVDALTLALAATDWQSFSSDELETALQKLIPTVQR